MTYCKSGDNPIIKYKFDGDARDRTFKARYAPITIETGEASASSLNEDYEADGFTILYPGGVKGDTVINYRTRINPINGKKNIQYWSCGATDWDNKQPDGSYAVWYDISDYPVGKTTPKCPTNNKKRNCFIRVSYNGLILHVDRGKCPIIFSAQCGNCSDGQHECESKVYPYYCCNSCADTAKKLNKLVDKYGRKL